MCIAKFVPQTTVLLGITSVGPSVVCFHLRNCFLLRNWPASGVHIATHGSINYPGMARLEFYFLTENYKSQIII